MTIDCLGHACFIVAAGETRVLFDPLLTDSHHEGLFEMSPSRRLDLDALPSINAVVISHRHFDHFDLPSLALLPREVPVLVPADDLLRAALHDFGFSNIVVVEPLADIRVDDLVLTPTPAAIRALETGYVVSDGVSTIWNMIDTVPAPEAVADVVSRFSRFDLAFVAWQPLLDSDVAVTDTPLFPLDMYRRLVQNALQASPDCLALSACGFRATPGFGWLNDVMFPMTPERFEADLLAARPEWDGRLLRPAPGDRITTGSKTSLHRAAVPYCRATGTSTDAFVWQPWRRRFEARAAAIPEAATALHGRVATFLDVELPTFIEHHAGEFFWHAVSQINRQFVIVFREGPEYWFLDFAAGRPTMSRGRSPLATAFSVLTGDALAALLDHRRTWSYVALNGDYFEADFGYSVTRHGVAAIQTPRTDPLVAFFAGADHEAATLRNLIAGTAS